MAGTDCCRWDGVRCGHGSGRVTSLDLGGCGLLSSELDPSIFSLTSLRYLNLAMNDFNYSKLPSTGFERLTELTHLNLSTSLFSGTVPASIGRLTNLVSLDLSYANEFRDHYDYGYEYSNPQYHLAVPGFKTLIANLMNLRELRLGFVHMPSDGADWCHAVAIDGFEAFRPAYVMHFDISFNMLEGQIPLPQQSITLDYSNNMFSSIPVNISTPLQYLITFRASRNNLSGSISESFCTPRLKILDLAYNYLSGSIPSCLMEGTNALQVLNLKRNKLRGELPYNVSKNCMLEVLDFGDNSIKGQLPRSLAACTDLEVLDIGNNQISDYFPCWMSTLARLQVFVLKSNRFFGQIEHYSTKDMHSCEFPSLRILDIASNNFSGSLRESWFLSLYSMVVKTANETMTMEYTDASQVYQVATIITYKGLDVSISNILASLVFIDISNNAFHGSIADAIGELVLLNVLNLSHNSFTGPIPSLLGHLTLLEVLDLSSNELSGEIPKERALLDFLTTLNLSYNNLVGRIPEPPHFMTFTNSSFLGNDGLCGPPLSKVCSDATTPSVVSHHSSKNSVDIVMFLFAGLGFGLGFAVAAVVTWGIPIRKRS
ncbi:hypothetical protein EJB05_31368, partial [Eragrostis curvula]